MGDALGNVIGVGAWGHATSSSVDEWLRQWIANPLLIERVSSNLTAVV